MICFRLKLKTNGSKFLNLKRFTVVHKLNQLLVDSASDYKVTITSSFMVFFGPARNVNATGRITVVKVTTDRAYDYHALINSPFSAEVDFTDTFTITNDSQHACVISN